MVESLPLKEKGSDMLQGGVCFAYDPAVRAMSACLCWLFRTIELHEQVPGLNLTKVEKGHTQMASIVLTASHLSCASVQLHDVMQQGVRACRRARPSS